MIYKEENRDLFSVPNDYYLAHCISADFALGKGIAVEFNKRFDMKQKLEDKYGDFIEYMHLFKIKGDCILIEDVFNLVTKERYFQKPTYKSIKETLIKMRTICIKNDIYKIAMPKIGCGLDKLEWSKVSEIIKEVFKNTDVEILVCVKD